MKKMTAIVLMLLQISCSLLAPQLGYAANATEHVSVYAADHAPDNHSLPVDQYPGEDQESESSLNLEESEEYSDELATPITVKPLHSSNSQLNRIAQQSAFLPGYVDITAPPPKA
jgi:hypothetical protein